MRLFSVIVLVGALSGCAVLEEVGTSLGGAAKAGLEAVGAKAPDAVQEIVDSPTPGTAVKVGIGLVLTFVTGAAGYFAIRKRRA